jgi:hypothetical protein
MIEIAEKTPTRAEFSEQVGTIFEAIFPDGEKAELKLAALDEIVVNDVQENFALLFRAPGGTPPAQGVYRLGHEKLGAMDIFLVPVKQDAEGLCLEAVFNNLLPHKEVSDETNAS